MMISSEGIRVFSAITSWGLGTLSPSLGGGTTTTPRKTQEKFVIIVHRTQKTKTN
jgi:hypothetical protein